MIKKNIKLLSIFNIYYFTILLRFVFCKKIDFKKIIIFNMSMPLTPKFE